MISSTGFKERREALLAKLAGAAAIFPAAPSVIRNADNEHEHRQDSDLYYLTGFEEPNSAAVLVPEHAEDRFVMFVQPKIREQEVWTGWRAGTEGALRDYGADAAFTTDKLSEELPGLLSGVDRIFYRFGIDPRWDERIVGLMRYFHRERQRNGRGPVAVVDPAALVHEMRLIKSPEELKSLRRAIDISAEGHLAAMREIRPGAYEYEIESALRHQFTRQGSRRMGYPPIVASGANATVLHYTTNGSQVKDGDLVLIDAGAEYDYYTGDITRTTPATGKFTREQAELYQIVLDAQLEAINQVRPGAGFNEPHDVTVRILTEGLVRLGLLTGEPAALIEEGEFRKFYMHRTSHWLGMDVHDAGSYKEGENWRALKPGMVLTIEPGLYVAEDTEGPPGVIEKYRGIGIRIEDDVLVTEDGHEVLSAAAPKSMSEIERAASRRS